MFDTETMAELCVRQGLIDQGIGILRRLAEGAGDAGVRLRYEARISELAQDPALSLFDPAQSVKLENSAQLVELGIMEDLGQQCSQAPEIQA